MIKVALRGMLQHKIRFALTTIAVVAGVAFVVGAFVLTDSVRSQFDKLFKDINSHVDLTVRGTQEFEQGAFGTRPPVPADLLGRIRDVPGVAAASGTASGMPALPIDADGHPVKPLGGPPLAVSWTTDDQLSTLTIVDGRPPTQDDEVAFDVDLASRGKFTVGQQVQVQTAQGPGQYTLVGTFEFGSGNALAGATLVAFTVNETQHLYNLEGKFNEISVAVANKGDVDNVQQSIEATLPPGTEVVTRDAVVQESQKAVGQIVDIFGNILLGYAGVTLFVAAFLISNIFTIVVGQRVRELALLRAVGASTRQVAGSVMGEALAVGILASLLGLGFGILVALGLNAVLGAAGFGTSGTSLVLQPRSFVAAIGVGLGVTVASATLPAWKATTVPPIAAMREGFSLGSVSMQVRGTIGAIFVFLGGGGIAWALFAKPDTVLLLAGLIGGALLVFLGVAALSPAIAGVVAAVIGRPFARIWKTPGLLAEQNAARNPRRTASMASALMIGLALISTALVVGNSLKESFRKTIGSSITADWYVSTQSFFGFSPDVVTKLKDLPELSAVTGGRSGVVQVDGSKKQVSGVDYSVVTQMFNLDILEGRVDGSQRGLLIQRDPASDLGVHPGDRVTVTFNDTGPVDLPVVAVYRDSSVLGNWVLDSDTFAANFTNQTDLWAAAKTADGVSEAEARTAIDGVLKPYPELKAQNRAEFTKQQAAQLDQLLIVINVFLLFAIVIAFLGITLTLLLSVFERTRELGLLRAVGMARVQVRTMVRLEAVIVAVFGALLGVVVGVLFGVTIAKAIPETVINQISVPIGSLLVMIVLSGIVGVLAALWPAYRAARLDILEAITTE